MLWFICYGPYAMGHVLSRLCLRIMKSAFPLSFIGFSTGPKFLLKMDGPRYRSINNFNMVHGVAPSNDSENRPSNNDAFEANEETTESNEF